MMTKHDDSNGQRSGLIGARGARRGARKALSGRELAPAASEKFRGGRVSGTGSRVLLLASLLVSFCLPLSICAAAGPIPAAVGEPAVASAPLHTDVPGTGMAGDRAAHWVNGFGVDMLRALLEESTDPNTMLSPLSLATALTMTAQGAAGATADAFANVLGYGTGEAAAAAQALAALNVDLERANPDLTLRQGNGLWLAPDLALHEAFAAQQQEQFGAEVASADFTDPATLEAINAWFSERTADRIPRLLDRLSDDTRIVLGNALYVKGRWQMPFDPAQTRPQSFHRADGQTTEVAMMQLDAAQFLYRDDAEHQALRLPFADPEFELLLALPAPGAPVAELLRPGASDSADDAPSGSGESTAAGSSAAAPGRVAGSVNLPEVLSGVGFRPRPGRLELPRFDLGTGGDLSEILQRMGLLQRQDFSRMAAEPLVFGPVVHKVAFAVDEAGAEAAAATAVVGVRSARPREPFAMVLDRPFLLGLQHRPSGTWLFLGTVGAP